MQNLGYDEKHGVCDGSKSSPDCYTKAGCFAEAVSGYLCCFGSPDSGILLNAFFLCKKVARVLEGLVENALLCLSQNMYVTCMYLARDVLKIDLHL